jgi:soluble lytic murein transglycosylase-like protein
LNQHELDLAVQRIQSATDYDRLFAKYTTLYWGERYDFRRLKCQAWRESNFDPHAVSHCGARGVMQIMPKTWVEIEGEIGVRDPFDPAQSIQAGISYMHRLYKAWILDHRSANWFQPWAGDRLWQYALGSYNAGRGNISRALTLSLRDQDLKKGYPDTSWETTAKYLDQVKNLDAEQVKNYVADITAAYAAVIA